MAKLRVLDITEFEGGMNSHTDPRDLEKNELELLNNLLTTNKGAIKVGYSLSDVADPPNLGLQTLNANMNGRNIYIYNNDFTTANVESPSSYILLSNGKKLFRLEGNSWVEITAFDGSAQSLNPSVVVYDGNLRYSDGSFLISSSSPYLNSNYTMFYGQLRRKYFNATTNTISSKSVKASIIKPTTGKIVFNNVIESSDNIPTRGTLGLEVNAIENTSFETRTFGDTDPITFSGVSGQSSSRVSIQTEFAKIGSILSDAAALVMKDTYGDNYTEAQIATDGGSLAQQFVTTSVSTGSINAYQIGNQLNAVDFNYFFITVNPANYNSSWGKNSEFSSTVANKRLRIKGRFNQYSGGSWSQVNWQYTDYSPTIHQVNADGSIGNAITPISTDNDQLGNLTYEFYDGDDINQYRVGVKTAAGEIAEITEIELFHHLATETTDATDLKHLRTYLSGVSEAQIKVNDMFNTDFQQTGNLIIVKVAVPTLTAIQTLDLIFTDNFNYSSSSNNLIYTLPQSWISQNKGMGWVDIIVDLSKISNTENSPIIGSLPDFIMRMNYNQASTEVAIAVDSIRQVKDNRGTWDGHYKFYYSWVYDRNQESGYYEFPGQVHGIEIQQQRLSAKAMIRELSAGGFGERAERITGANVYYKEWDKEREEEKYDDPFMLMQCDFEKGVLKPQGTTLFGWALGETATDHYVHESLQFIDPTFSSTFSISSGYEYNALENIEEIRFKAFTNLNRRIYYGNVDVLWEKFSGETNYKRNRYQDRVYKSLSNKPDIIPSYNYLDIDINDGDEITALSSYADRLLVFKTNMMYLVNATQQVEYLEDKYKFKGVASNRGVTSTDIGVAWVNEFGAYHYDGESVKELSKNKLLQSTFATDIGSNPNIVYEPKLRHLVITNSGGTSGYIYNLNTDAWSKTSYGFGANNYNIVYYNNKITSAVISSGEADFSQLDISTASNEQIVFDVKTKDFSFGSVGTKVDVKAVYVTYKGTVNGSSEKISVNYYKDKGSTPNGFTGADLATSPSGYTTAKLIPNPKTNSKKLNTMQLRIFSSGTNSNAFKDFELHDISIVYREKSVK